MEISNSVLRPYFFLQFFLLIAFAGSVTPAGILNDVIPTTTSMADPRPLPTTSMDKNEEANWASQILNDPSKLRLMLEALLLDDLKRRDSNFDVKEILGTSVKQDDDASDTFLPKADRSTQETTEGDTELSPEQMDFFGDGI